jgi:S-(hydroxymethyl)glutathione dehydrogenase/alcohol dehydrogenase
MRGIVYTGDGAGVTDQLEVRAPGPTDVRVAIGAAGVCHSDLSVLNGTIPWKSPSVLGHEGAGVVEAVGSEVTSVEVGDHVVIATLASCGLCRACSTGHPTWCLKTLSNVTQPFTYEGRPASNFAGTSVFTELTVVKEVQAVKISKDVPMTSACLIGCGVLTGVGSVLNRAKVQAGETAVVFGAGGVGLNAIQGLRIAGASRIIAVDILASKEGLARRFGATHFIDSSVTDPVEAIRDIVPPSPGRVSGALGWTGGVNWAFDCVGDPIVLRNALDVLDWGGNAMAIGIPPQGTEILVDVNALAYVDRGLMGCRYGSSRPQHDIPLMVDLYLSGQLLLDELVTEQLPLDGFRQIVEDMEQGKLARGVLTF